MIRRLPLFALLLSAPLALSATQVYKWVDDQGVTHYGDLPPHHDAVITHVKPIPAPSGGGGGGGEGARQQPKNADAARPDDSQAAEFCRRARDDLRRYQEAERLVRSNPDGSQTALDEADREKLLEETRAREQRWCQ